MLTLVRVPRGMAATVLLVFLVNLEVGAQSKVGTTAVPFLEIGTGAAHVGRGEAAVASVQGASSLYWNPGTIARIRRADVSAQITPWHAGTQLQYIAGVVPAGTGSVGISLYLFDSGEMPVTTIDLEDGTGEMFRVQDLSLGFSYGRMLTERFSLGGTAKLIRTRLWRMSASTLALDLGFVYATPWDRLQLGFSISNFGGELSLSGDNTTVRVDQDPLTSGDHDGILANLAVRSWDLPLLTRFGAAWSLIESPAFGLEAMTDVLYPNSRDPYMNFGMEATLLDLLVLRGGYSNVLAQEVRGLGRLRVGVGLRLADRMTFDFALSDRGDLDATHHFGLGLTF